MLCTTIWRQCHWDKGVHTLPEQTPLVGPHTNELLFSQLLPPDVGHPHKENEWETQSTVDI